MCGRWLLEIWKSFALALLSITVCYTMPRLDNIYTHKFLEN
jgi:hypothetical protein